MKNPNIGRQKQDRGRYTQEVIDRCRRLCELHSMAEVARIVGVSDTFIGNAKRRGWKPADIRGKRLPARPHDLLLNCDDMSVEELAAHYGVCRGTVRKWLVGVPRNYQPKPVDRSKPIPSREAIEEALKGRKVSEAADLLGCHTTTLERWRAHYGMPVAHRRKKKRPEARPAFGWADNFFRGSILGNRTRVEA